MGQREQERQNGADKTGQAEQVRQNGTGRKGKTEQDRQHSKYRTGQQNRIFYCTILKAKCFVTVSFL
jgi:hypothetical protein